MRGLLELSQLNSDLAIAYLNDMTTQLDIAVKELDITKKELESASKKLKEIR